MNEPGVYVVRIYRRDNAGMAGVVESVASGEQAHFGTAETLWRALCNLPSSRRDLPTGYSNEENSR